MLSPTVAADVWRILVLSCASLSETIRALVGGQHARELLWRHATDIEGAFSDQAQVPDCVLVAGPQSAELLAQLRARFTADDCPAVILTDAASLERSGPHGAQDWLRWEDTTPELLARTVLHVCEKFAWLREKRRLADHLLPALAAAQVGTWEWDVAHDRSWCSAAWFALYGRPVTTPDMTFREWLSWIHPEDAARAASEICNALGGAPYHTEFRVVWPDGTVHWLSARAHTISENGKATYLIGANIDITGRKRAEAELARAEERLRVTVESANVGIWGENLETGELQGSPIARRLHDAPEGIALTRDSEFAYVHPEDQPRVSAELQRAVLTGSSFSSEHRVIWRDGSIHWVHSAGRAAVDPADGSRWLLGIVQDLTARKQAEERLTRQEERLRLAQEAGNIGFYDWNPETNEVYWSEQVYRMFGLEPGCFESSFDAWLRRVHPDDREKIAVRLKQGIAERRERWTSEYRAILPQTGYRWIRALNRMYYDTGGRPLRGLGTLIDITEQVHAREQIQEANLSLQRTVTALSQSESDLRLSQLRFSTMAEAVPGILFTSDSAGYRDYVSKQYYTYTGTPEGSAEGFGWKESVHPDDLAGRVAGWTERVESDRPFAHELRLRRFDGEYRWFRVYAYRAPGADSHISKWFGVLVDIHDERQARTTLEHTNAEMEKFLSVVSHDLQVPIRTVQTLSGWLRERHGFALDSEGMKLVGFIETSARRMHGLVSTLLDYSRAGEAVGQMVQVDCGLLAERTLRSMEAAISEAGAEVIAGTLPAVLADPTQLEQVFQNLLDNAIKYRSQEPPRIRITAGREDGRWTFSIADNGIGISNANLERVFLPFERLPSTGKQGRGMGLAICRRIIERHGGRIWAESGESGSVFRFTLPAIEEQSEEKSASTNHSDH